MRAYVWTDKALTRHAGRFVWLSLDIEKAKNAAARKHIGIQAFPTLYVLDPADGRVAIRWIGGASVVQLERLFDDGELAVKGGAHGPAIDALVEADRAYGASDFAAAAKAYERALDKAPEGWPAYGRTVEALMFAYSSLDSLVPSVQLAMRALPHVEHTNSEASIAAGALDATVQLPESHPQRALWLQHFEKVSRKALADPQLSLAGDDRSGVYFTLEDAREAAHDSLGRRQTMEEHVAMLEHQAATASSAEQRAVYDSHRLSLYISLGRPEAAIPMLEQSQKDFPTDYNPPARLASAYKATGRWNEALAASDRALARVYGPRQFLVLTTRADIQLALGDKASAKKTLTEAIAKAEAMPEGLRSEGTVRSLKKKLEGLGETN